MDLRVPGMEGLTAIKHLRPRPEQKAMLPVIVVTTDPPVDLRERCIAGGADEVLHRPVAMGALLGALGRMAAKSAGGETILL